MRTIHAVPAALAVSLLLAGCGAAQPAAPVAASSPATAAPGATTSPASGTASPGHSADDRRGHVDEDYGIPAVTWDAAAEKAVTERAVKVMGLFARPEVPEKKWFADLRPFLAPEYAESARYIDPARVTVRKVVSGPELKRQSGNPLTVFASFETNDGTWYMVLHRSGQDKPWLVSMITAEDPTKI